MNRLCIVAAITLCASSAAFATNIEITSPADPQVRHVLNRLTFGTAPGDIGRVKQIGVKAFIEEQLNPSTIRDSKAVLSAEAQLPAARESAAELVMAFRQIQKAKHDAQVAAKSAGVETPKDILNDAQQNLLRSGKQYMSARLMRDVESPRQLEAVMSEFWFNHFNVYLNKNMDRILVGPYEQQAIRPYALGRFRDLLAATCYHPAMLYYLDNWQNTAPGSNGSRGRFNGLNENYARELMELHTLGVDGGYTQKDVTELARVLTGLGLRMGNGNNRRMAARLQPVGHFGAYFDSSRHDFGSKTVIGHQISGSGVQEIDQALDLLARAPATAHHISYQLAQYFLCDTPPAALVNRLSSRFLSSDGDIKTVLRELFYSPEFSDPKYFNAKYKTPLRFAVSALRVSGADPESFDPVIAFLRAQGEPLYGSITPDGYKNTTDAWLNPDALLGRINFATALASGKMQAVLPQAPEYRQLGYDMTGSTFTRKTAEVTAKAPETLKSAVLLGSPEFMHY